MLIRICVSRAEIDMVQIKKTFADMYGQTLGRFISVSQLFFVIVTVRVVTPISRGTVQVCC